ncbi:helix-turn-helix transcriptional regulator [Rhodococcus sp. UFZ-B548]|uniref:helix-turn-helix domain-containing protein n=1 Tax=Rhodococcus sp. UFZ-B548 TaxID=2742212 RepID=UPI0015F6CAB5|nr:helix-turn-helix transcriptional regulator [Rhodococcus sp. UFZ-B548]
MHQENEASDFRSGPTWTERAGGDSQQAGRDSGWRNQGFGTAIRVAREELGLSQRGLADKLSAAPWNLKLDPSAITRLEKGQREAKLAEAQVLAVVLGLSLDDINDFESHHDSTQFSLNEIRVRNAMRDARGAILRALRASQSAVNAIEGDESDDLAVLAERNVSTFYDWIDNLASGMERSFRFTDPKYGDGVWVYDTEASLRSGQRIVEAVVKDIFISEKDFAAVDDWHDQEIRGFWLDQARVALEEAYGESAARERFSELFGNDSTEA